MFVSVMACTGNEKVLSNLTILLIKLFPETVIIATSFC